MVPIIRFWINTCIKCHKTFKTLPFLMNMSLCSWIISTCKKVEASFDIKHRWPSCNTSLPPLEEVSKTSYFSFITWEMNFCPLIIKGDLRPNFTCFFFHICVTVMEKEPSTTFCDILIIFHKVMKFKTFEFDESDIIPANLHVVSCIFFVCLFICLKNFLQSFMVTLGVK